MKRVTLALAAFALLCALAQGAFAEGDKNYTKSLVSKGLYAQFGAIQDSAQELPMAERLWVYEACKKDALNTGALGAAVNFFLGFGIGSYVIGDVSSGVLGTCLDVGTSALTITGIVIMYMPIINAASSGDPSTMLSSNPFENMGTGLVVMLIGSGLSLVSRIVQIVTPFVYVNSYNKKLNDALLISLGADRIAPSLAYARPDGTEAPALGLKIFL